MMPLSSRSLGLGLLTTLAGSFGMLLPSYAAPGDLGTAADLEVSGGSGAAVESVVDATAPEPAPSETLELSLPQSSPPSPETVVSTATAQPWADSTAAIAAATVLPSGDLPTPATNALPGAAGVPLANRSANSELYEFRFGGDQLPLN
ncbi:MAG: hypothetical protein DCF32_11140, partial [Leptolyngbya sp.]